MENFEDRSKVKWISVQGFRGFREQQEVHLAQPNGRPGSGLTIVVGANNVGKSTIWEAFDALARKFNPGAYFGNDISFSEGKRNRQTPSGVRIAIGMDSGLECAIESLSFDTSETHAVWNTEDELRPQIPSLVVVPSRRQFQARFSRGGDASQTWMTSNGEFSRYQSRDGFAMRLFDLHADVAKKKRFDALLAEVIGEQLDWSIELGDGDHGSSYYLKVAASPGVHYTSEGLGEGIVSLLFVLNALYDAPEDSVVVIDEPELSLHPQLVRRLAKVLATHAKDRQIVIFTHSPMLVSWDAVSNGAAVVRVFKEGVDSRVAQAPSEVLAEVSKLQGSWQNPHVVGLDALEALFLEDRIIVVEGQDDAGLLPKVAELASVELEGVVYGWGAGGEGSVEKILGLLHSLGFKKVVALFDNNVPEKVAVVRGAYPQYLTVTIPAADIRTKKHEKERAEKPGLLDVKARGFAKSEYEVSTREVLERVNRFLCAPVHPGGETEETAVP
ncbi:ATP-dependent endonuclease [Microbacterium esteraromaticum]|uniref:ATP-dependent nuclease n=1 Tax=Microbacterium esteraromaticum TaxID=57043 RepID=UPI001C960B61|nr:AAA family ATPase [Microbacterium esteraromaticum]MBY6061969.1 AAA family ATPase [Microbacterium esteraromaticum]